MKTRPLPNWYPGLVLSALLLLFSWQQSTAQQQVMLGDELFDALDRVLTLNEQHKYLEAYRAAVTADRQLEDALHGHDVSQLSQNDFKLLYWPVKKSRAEVAYALGLHDDMARTTGQLRTALDKQLPLEQAWRDSFTADLLKIEGGRCFLIQAHDRALEALNEALALKPHDNWFALAVRDDLAQVHYAQGQYLQALAQLDTVLASPPFNDSYRMPHDSAQRLEIESQRALCLARMGEFSQALDLISPIVEHYNDRDQRHLAEALRKQGKILILQQQATGQINDDARHCYDRYLSVMKAYVDSCFLDMDEDEREQFWMAEQPFVTDCYALEDQDPGLLYDVALFSKAVLLQMGRDFKDGMSHAQRSEVLSTMRVCWQDVQRSLPARGAAIEFITYQKEGQRNHLGALVITQEAARPVFIHIADADSLLAYQVTGLGRSLASIISRQHDDDGNNAMYNDSTLAAMIWNPSLTAALDGCSDIYFAADGILHALAIEYLLPDSLQQARLYRLTSTRLLTAAPHQADTRSMLLCGYADFERSCHARATIDNDAVAYSIQSSESQPLAPLPHSLVEIDSVLSIRGHRAADRVLLQDSVSEVLVRQLMERYHMLLISTHGKSGTALESASDLRPSSSDTGLSGSCLFLAGANATMRDHQFDASRHADGILSARELAGMDLSGVDLAVLSACLTGRGQILTDGVYGLQRGLKAAGVHAMIVSLWEVSDETTSMLMSHLFSNLEQGMSIHQAFYQAREALRRELHDYKSYTTTLRGQQRVKRPYDNKPCYYDAFILVDAR